MLLAALIRHGDLELGALSVVGTGRGEFLFILLAALIRHGDLELGALSVVRQSIRGCFACPEHPVDALGEHRSCGC